MTIQANFPNLRPSLLLDFQNTKQLDSRITYTRASTASFYNGVTTAKAEENLFSYSQELDNAVWQVGSATVTANTTAAPDGTTTAETLTATASTNRHSIFRATATFPTVNGSAYMASFFVKANTNNFVQIIVASQSADFANFNLSTGALGTTGGTGSSATITSVGNSWYRITMPYTAGGTDRDPALVIISSATAARGESWTTVGTESVYVWGAQIEIRSSVTAYTATTTQAITNYIPALQTAASGVARFDNNPTTGESLGLLIEESRTNLNVYSSDFSNAVWTKVQGSITANIIVAPDGTLTGSKFVESTATTTQHNVYQIGRTIGATSNTASVYLKAGERTAVYFVIYDVSTNAGAYFNLANGTITSTDSGVTSSITSVGNGWYRCVITRTTASTANGGMNVFINSGSTSYTGDGFSGIYIWGAQLEAGAFATSYIPTVASQVTRAADAATMTGVNFSNWYNQGEQTWYIEYAHTAVGGNARRVLTLGGTGSDYNDVLYGISSTGDGTFMTSTGVAGSINSTIINPRPTTMTKFGIAFKVNDYQSAYSGSLATSDTSFAMPIGINRLGIGCNYDGGQQMVGYIKKIAYYPLRVTNANLQALTS